MNIELGSVAGFRSRSLEFVSSTLNFLSQTMPCNERIEPINNPAERALRHPIILRKLSYGSHS